MPINAERERLLFILNMIAMVMLSVGYILITGLKIIDSEALKAAFRAIAGGSALVAIFIGGRANMGFFGLLLLLMITILVSGNMLGINLIFLAVAVQALITLGGKRAATVLFWSAAAGVSVHILGSALGLVSTVTTNVSGRLRDTGGLANANQAALIYLSLVTAALLMHLRVGTKKTRVTVILSVLVSLPVIIGTDSRTSLLSLAILFALTPVFYWTSSKRPHAPVLRAAIASVPIAGAVATYWLASTPNIEMDYLFSFRPSIFASFLLNLQWSDLLFGWSVPPWGEIDSSYLMLLSTVGGIAAAIIIMVLAVFLYRMRIVETPIAIMILIAGVTESFLMRPEILLTPLLMTVVLERLFSRDGALTSAGEASAL